jgi:hypothetical protein
LYGIETVKARRAFRIGHVHPEKLLPGDLIQAWDHPNGRGWTGVFNPEEWGPPGENYRVELHIPREVMPRLNELIRCKTCGNVPDYSFFKFSDGQVGLKSTWKEKKCDCSCMHRIAPPEVVALLDRHAAWDKMVEKRP